MTHRSGTDASQPKGTAPWATAFADREETIRSSTTMKLQHLVTVLAFAALAGLAPLATAQSLPSTLPPITDPALWLPANRAATLHEENGRTFVRLDARTKDGVLWLRGSDFASGTIEVDLRGRDAPGQSFVGLAFRGVDATTCDAVYFRPFNFKNADVPRRARAVQYISHPKFPWEKLRAEHPGKYEQSVAPVPDPNGWFHARLVFADRQISVYVDHATAPSLVVTELSERKGGLIGFWVGNGSSGDFANLKITTGK